MTEPNDDLMNRLAAADPTDHRSLPTSDAPEARQLLENAMSAHPSIDEPARAPAADVPAADAPVRLLDLPEVPGLDRYSGHGRSRILLVGAAAAVILLVAGFLVFAPDNATPALAAVHSAAQATAAADTGRVTTTFSLEGTDGAESEQIAGRLEASFASGDIAFSVEIDETIGTSDLGALPVTEARLVDGVFYANDGTQWYSVETSGFIGQTLVDVVDPRSVLATVQDLLETEEIDTAVVDGVSTTHYRSVVDLGDDSLTESGWLALQGLDVDVEGSVTVDLFVDDDGLLRQLDIAGDLREPGDGAGTAMFMVSTSFFDIGTDLTVDVPADAIEINPLEGFDGTELFNQND